MWLNWHLKHFKKKRYIFYFIFKFLFIYLFKIFQFYSKKEFRRFLSWLFFSFRLLFISSSSGSGILMFSCISAIFFIIIIENMSPELSKVFKEVNKCILQLISPLHAFIWIISLCWLYMHQFSNVATVFENTYSENHK